MKIRYNMDVEGNRGNYHELRVNLEAYPNWGEDPHYKMSICAIELKGAWPAKVLAVRRFLYFFQEHIMDFEIEKGYVFSEKRDLFALLGVPIMSTQAEISELFLRWLQNSHPDATQGSEEKSRRYETFARSIGMWKIMRDPLLRERYCYSNPLYRNIRAFHAFPPNQNAENDGGHKNAQLPILLKKYSI